MHLTELWHSRDPQAWTDALARYRDYVQPTNLTLERELEQLDLALLKQLDAYSWYDFLLHKYFRWKYTAKKRYVTTTRRLRWYADEGRLDDLHLIKQRLLALDTNGVRHGLSIALAIQGLGTAGTSGLLALMYPQTFATVDQFVLKALRRVRNLPEAVTLGKMYEHALSLKAGVLLIDIMQRKATENNRIFDSADWTLSTARQHSVTSFRGRHPGERRGPVSSWIPACAGMTCGNIPPMLDTGL